MSTPAPTPAPSVPPVTGPVMIANARIKDLAPTVVSEQIADSILFTYNPLTQAASFAFNSREYVYINGVPQQLAGTNPDLLQLDVEGELLTQFPGMGLADPVTGADLSNISVAAITLIVKAAFDILYNRRAQAEGLTDPNQPYPSLLAIMQANSLYDYYGNGKNGFPLGRAFGGVGTNDGAPSPTPAPTPPNPIAPPAPVPTPNAD